MSLEGLMGRWRMVVACLPLVMLTGCPQENAGAPGKVPMQATAPAATQGSAPGAKAGGVDAGASVAQVPDPAKAARAQQIIDEAEKAYRGGVENYRAGRLDAARVDFDRAVDGMLRSGMDLKADAQLSDEFTRLLDAVNSLEMSALKQGNGFSPKLEESPLENAEDLTFPANPELTAKLKAELEIKSDLPLVINDQVAGYIGYFANSSSFRIHMLHSLERAGKYKAIIQKALADQGLPQDLFYLAVAESGFQPQALNAKSGAGGMWQFMPTNDYLKRNGYFDERFDPEKSSSAYARYMKVLYKQFGDWYLAMAAYDWGPLNVQRAVMKTGYADFWELYRRNAMPKETKAYVPQILAAMIMAKNPAKYGLDKMVPEAAVTSDTVNVNYAIDLRLVADLTEATVQTIVALNPSLLRMATPREMMFDLHLPVGTKDLYTERLKDIPEDKRTSWRFHVVRSGESLEAVATALHGRASEIAEVNGIAAGQGVAAGDELIVPVATAAAVAHTQRYTARRGDTLVTVADRFNVSVEDLRSWNRLKTSAVRPGQALNVAAPVRLGPMTRVRGKRARAAGRSVTKPATRAVATSGRAKGVAVNSAAGKSAARTTSASNTKASPKKISKAAR